jgi:3',5'-cyclic-AMP phosphodiesterase
MPRPLRLLQITDSHLGARWQPRDPVETLRTVLTAIAALPEAPDAIVHTGDLTNDGSEDQYADFARAVAGLGCPLLVLPGNHDDRATMRRVLELPGTGDEPIQDVLELGALRVIALDTVRPGEPGGELGAWRRQRLAERLAEEPDTPTVLALHHPPFLSGLPGMDGIALARDDRVALATLLERHPQVVGLIAGHVHRAITAVLAGRPALTIPGTYAQAPLDFGSAELPMIPEPLAFAVHTVIDGRLVSHTQALAATAAA